MFREEEQGGKIPVRASHGSPWYANQKQTEGEQIQFGHADRSMLPSSMMHQLRVEGDAAYHSIFPLYTTPFSFFK